MLAGKLFHTRGPATAKLHVPSTVLVLGTTRHQLSADCSLSATVVTGNSKN